MSASSHYQSHSADSYEENYFYEAGAYQQYLVDLVRDRLRLPPSGDSGRHIIDIGGGTGNFSQALVQGFGSKSRVTVVDPFLDQTNSDYGRSEQVSFVKAPAEAFLNERTQGEEWRMNFQQVLLKEVVHHLEDRVGVFRGMHREVIPANDQASVPSVLIITRPQTEIDYPLWDAARQVWKDNQPSAEELAHDLEQAGFVNIQHSLEAYPCQITLARWQSMVQNRFWSTFSHFSDEELSEACQVLAKEHADKLDEDGVLRFDDRLVFITAQKEL